MTFFGEIPLVGRYLRELFAEAVTDCTLCAMGRVASLLLKLSQDGAHPDEGIIEIRRKEILILKLEKLCQVAEEEGRRKRGRDARHGHQCQERKRSLRTLTITGGNMKKKWQILTVSVLLSGFLGLVFTSSGLAARVGNQPPSPPQKPANPRNPCAKKKGQSNPCAQKKKGQNPCNPCAAKKASSEVYAAAVSHRGWMKVNQKPILSQSHGGTFVTAYVNPTADSAVKSKAASFPVGSILVKDSFANASGKPGAKGTIFAMEKTDHGWLWVTTDATGHFTGKGDNQQMQMCAKCHTAAKMDFAFLRAK